MSKTTDIISSELNYMVDEEKRSVLLRFFKTGKGEYGEGDKFLGVTVPNIRSVASQHLDIPVRDVEILLASPWHEIRMCGLLIMVECCKNTRKKSWIRVHSEEKGEELRKQCFELYLKNTARINNWDLVDLSAPVIIGEYIADKPRDVLYHLAESTSLWEQRIAVVSTLVLIRKNDFNDIYMLAEMLLHHPHDLMQKAIGWMLREVGKMDEPRLLDFLDNHSIEMPRTMLRYAIEKFTDVKREYYMKRT